MIIWSQMELKIFIKKTLHTNIEPLCWTSETNMMLYVNYVTMKEFLNPLNNVALGTTLHGLY